MKHEDILLKGTIYELQNYKSKYKTIGYFSVNLLEKLWTNIKPKNSDSLPRVNLSFILWLNSEY